jgi:signal transduction histidine kinase
MDVQVLLPTSAALVSLYAASFHGWVFALHPAARDHLWVAVCATGAAGVCLGTADLYAARSPSEAFAAQQLQGLGVPVLSLGLLRFASSHFGVTPRALLRMVDLWSVVALVVMLLAPELLIDRSEPLRQGGGLGLRFIQLQYKPLTVAMVLPACGALLGAFAICLRARREGRLHATQLLGALTLWTVAGAHDGAVGFGLWAGPYLLASGGYLALVVSVSSILFRELVLVMEESESQGLRLQELASARADELRAVELRLARGEQLAAVGTLAAGVAHEINNPLAYVSANLNHLQGLWQEGLRSPATPSPSAKRQRPSEVDEVLAECREGLNRVASIASDLLRMARHGASEREVVELADVTRSVLPLAEREASGEVAIEVDLAEGLRVLGSARLLGQVVLNLVLNAIHASAGHAAGARWVRLETRAARSPDGASGVELRVCDSGPGIPEALQDRIFDSAFTSKPISQGAGLGLALVRLIVARHGGTIHAENGVPGAAVTVWLPAVP